MLKHSWDITPIEAIALQKKLALRVRAVPIARKVHTIAGVDCAFVGRAEKKGDRHLFQKAKKESVPFSQKESVPFFPPSLVIAAAVLCDARTLEIIVHSDVTMPCEFPYIPGLLSFREAPAVIEAIRKLSVRPDLVMIDGQGLAHPRGLGIASHVGLWLGMPTIGVAKSRLCGEHRPVWPRRGSHTRLMLNGVVVGSVVRTRDNVNPLYVSVGHRVTLAEAVRWTVRCATKARLPEPTRLAHQLVTRLKKNSGRLTIEN